MILGLSYQDRHIELGLLTTEGHQSRSLDASFEHTENLASLIPEFLSSHQCQPKELAAIVVATGPGSYTGLRLTITVSKTIAQVVGCPIYGHHSLEGLIRQEALQDGVYGALIPAMKGWSNLAFFTVHQHAISRLSTDTLLKDDDLIDHLNQIQEPIALVGTGSDTLADKLTKLSQPHTVKLECVLGTKTLCSWAKECLQNGHPTDFKKLAPIYANTPV